VLAQARSRRPVIQDFRPLAESLEWELGQRYFQERGNKAFISDPEPVPFLVNNDGTLSARAAAVLLASLEAADRDGTLEADIFVLELGIGVGLFARYFLDSFQKLCEQRGKDYYDRLCYVAADRSEQMLRDAGRHGIFANHAGRYVLRVADALCPERDLPRDPLFGELAPKPFRAVFMNYLLDCQPAAVLRLEGDRVEQLWVRTCLARGADLGDFTSYSVEDLAQLAASPDARQRRELLEVFDLLTCEYAYRPANLAALHYGDFAVRAARANNHSSILHNYGAIQCLERLFGLLRHGGFILFNDYGQVQASAADGFEHQRFSQATGVWINFPLLGAYFSGYGQRQWIEAEEGNAGVHSRLLGNNLAPEASECFRRQFGKEAREWLDAPVQRAKEACNQGRFEVAVAAFHEALERQPHNWALMGETANLLTSSLHDAAAGLEVAKAALACNPGCSADLWNTAGVCLLTLGRVEEGRQAYLRALRVNPDDVRARFNLAAVYAQSRQYGLALRTIAEALGLDRGGSYREGLLQKQSEILARLAQRHQQHYQAMANRVSTPLSRDPAQGVARGTGVIVDAMKRNNGMPR
jgi:tetratricopeptide (TPR) repeat protein